jgi:hypothetical protein
VFTGAPDEKITSWLKRLEIAEDAAKGMQQQQQRSLLVPSKLR